MIILGISAYYHDAAAAILVDGEVIAASCEERFTRKKHDKGFPAKAITCCVKEANISYVDIDYVVFYEKPFVKFERILATHIHHAPIGFHAFAKAIPIWLKERLNMKKTISKELNLIWQCHKDWDIRFVEHHMSHAAMAYYTSAYENAAILVIDAVGENATTSILKGTHEKITLIKQQRFPNSIGLLYSAFTYFLGFTVNSDEYKVMGLAPYGDLNDVQTERFIDIIESQLVKISEDGSIVLNERYFTFMFSLKMVNDHVWEKLFGMAKRQSTDEISQAYMNMAAAIQYVAEKILLRLVRHAKEITGSENLCISGGCALNCAAMGKLRESGLFKSVFVPFAPGDDGGAIGASLYLYSLMGASCNKIVSPYLSTEYSDDEIAFILAKSELSYKYFSDDELYTKVAAALDEGKVVGWFQGRMEFGPRALGNRSILADPRKTNMKNIVNSKVKFRESFRPFAPIVVQEEASSYFRDTDSPYMMFTTQVNPGCKSIPVVTHVDGSARVQTVTEKENRPIYVLLQAFKKLTGCSVLLNTSFNIMGEPIVCSPTDAIHTFTHSGIDILVINHYIITK